MRSHRKLILATIFSSAFALNLYSQVQTVPSRAEKPCRAGNASPLVGAWSEDLTIAGIGTSLSLATINQGGTLTETDGIDLVHPTRNPSFGYGSWKALDCEHYRVIIKKVIYDTMLKHFETSILTGSVTVSKDGSSFNATLTQMFYNAKHEVLSMDMVTDNATRIQVDSPEDR